MLGEQQHGQRKVETGYDAPGCVPKEQGQWGGGQIGRRLHLIGDTGEHNQDQQRAQDSHGGRYFLFHSSNLLTIADTDRSLVQPSPRLVPPVRGTDGAQDVACYRHTGQAENGQIFQPDGKHKAEGENVCEDGKGAHLQHTKHKRGHRT